MALSDPQGWLASPLLVLERKGGEADLKTIADLARRYEVVRIVVGLPRSMDGSLGEQAKRVQAFIEQLSGQVEVPVEAWDERLSTVAAERLLREAGWRGQSNKTRRDAAAAALILQGYLDSLRECAEP